MQQVLNRINKIQGVRGSLVVGPDGFVAASDLASGDDPNLLGAMASTIAHTLDGALEKLKRGDFKRLVLSGTEGRVVVSAIGESAYLVTILKKDATLGVVLVELRDTAKELASHLTF